MSSYTVYNLFWQAQPRAAEAAVALGGLLNTLAFEAPVRAAILWPTLLTPQYLEPGKDLQLLIGEDDPRVQSGEALSKFAVRCLRATVGLHSGKVYGRTDQPLLADGRASDIVAKPVSDEEIRSEAHYRRYWFAGAIHPSRRGQFSGLYWLTIKAGAIDWKAATKAAPNVTSVDPAQPFTEWEDELLAEALDLRCGEGSDFRAHFRPGGRQWVTRSGQPVCSFHPVLYKTSPPRTARTLTRYLHVSDMHLSSRQDILRQSAARVIEALPETPQLANRVASYRANLDSTLAEAFNKEESRPDAVLIGGDLMDHSHSAWRPEVQSGSGDGTKRPEEVWNAVGLSPDQYRSRYEENAFVDLIDAFEVFVGIYTTYRVGTFGVTGNHDAYRSAYGISPRVGGWIKANEGIPLDHNLTFSEAILAFGPTYGTIRKSLNFDKDVLEWFHSVFTSLSSFLVEGPAGPIIGLGWGDKEMFLDFAGDPQVDGLVAGGFLPRANAFPTPEQKDLLRLSRHAAKKVTVLLHPPVASFHSSIPETSGTIPLSIPVDDVRLPTKLQMGTFTEDRLETHRLLAGPNITAVISGHSHRRSEYWIGPEAEVQISVPGGRAARRVSGVDRSARMGSPVKGEEGPRFVVSASAGPVPRSNRSGLFGQWGSESPGGTRLDYEAGTGDMVGQAPVFASGCKPRLCAALDFLQHMESPAAKALTALRVSFSIEACPSRVSISLKVNTGLLKAGLRIARLVCAGIAVPYLDWRRALASPAGLEEFRFFCQGDGKPRAQPLPECTRSDDSPPAAEDWFNFWHVDPTGSDGKRWETAEAPWMAIYFAAQAAPGSELTGYDLGDPWTIELEPTAIGGHQLVPREVPDFNYRKRLYFLRRSL